MEAEVIRFAARSGVGLPRLPIIPRAAAGRLAKCPKPVFEVTAPAGSGKTALVTQMCERSGQPFVWLRAEARMARMGVFLSALAAAFRAAFPKASLPEPGAEEIARPAEFLRRLIAMGSGGRPLLIVFDDLYVLPVDARPLRALAEARRGAADGVRLVLVFREEPHPAWTWFGAVERVGFETLRLDAAEAGALLRPVDIEAGWTADALLEACGGWILGARLLLETLSIPLVEAAARRARLVTLGRFDVVVEGRSRLTSAKPPRGPIALAIHLVAAGPAGRRVEALADRLWPDADEAVGRRRMKSTVHRLRRMLGGPGAVLTRGGCVALDPETLAVDAWELEALASAPGEDAEARHAEGMRLYAGPFVHHHVDDTGSLAYGRKMERMAAGLCVAFARELIRAGDGQGALRVAREGLERIGYHEELFEIAAEAAGRLGRRSELDALSDVLAGG